MSLAEKQALVLRNLAVNVAKAKGVLTAPNLYTYQDDARLLIEYRGGKPHGLDVFKYGDYNVKVLSVIWNDGGDEIVLIHRTGSWEDSLKRLAKAVIGAAG